jgi:hypothetical protein
MNKPKLKVLMQPIKEVFPEARFVDVFNSSVTNPVGYKMGLAISNDNFYIEFAHPFESYRVIVLQKSQVKSIKEFLHAVEAIEFAKKFL